MKTFDRFGRTHCHQVSGQLSEYLHEGLPAQQQETIQSHLASCAACQSELQAAREMEATLRLDAFRHQPQISKSASLRIRQNIYQALRRGIMLQQTFKFVRLVFVATVMLLLAIKGDRLLRQWSIRPQPAAQQTQIATPPTATPAQLPTLVPANERIVVIATDWEENDWQRNFNPFSFKGHAFAIACFYEPLMLQNNATGEVTPWLASAYAWNEEKTLLTFSLRKGIRWSDGEDLHADDVVATFILLRDHPEITGIPEYPHPVSALFASDLSDVSAPDDDTVQFQFKNANPGALAVLINTPIIPKHEWEKIEDPAKFTNANPVGSGPFTAITRFETRQNGRERTAQFERNPYYWQADQIGIQGVRYSLRPESYALQDLKRGIVDWAMLELSNPKKDFVALSPDLFHVGIIGGGTKLLYLNTSRFPFSHVLVRQAISLGINRQAILDLLPTGNTAPARASGISPFEPIWWDGENSGSGYWMEYDPQMANSILDELGFVKSIDGMRIGPTGTPMRFVYYVSTQANAQESELTTQIAYQLAEDLHAIGIELTILAADEKVLRAQVDNEDFDMLLLDEDADAYWLYQRVMSPSGYSLYGSQKTNAEAKRYFSEASRPLFDAFGNTSDAGTQSEIMSQLQAIFIKDTPLLPLYSTAYYYQYNTSRFTGFPTQEDRYETGINIGWDALPVFLRLRPR